MPRLLRAYLNSEIASDDFVIHYEMVAGLGGDTYFHLQGDGSYELSSTVTAGHESKSYLGQVPVFRVKEVVKKMLSTKVWQVQHDHASRWLDDPGAKITVEAGNENSFVMLWVSEIRESPPFVRVQRQFLSLIHEISKGEVLEKGHGTGNLFPEENSQERRSKHFLFNGWSGWFPKHLPKEN